MFQSTPAHGGRPVVAASMTAEATRFNPRPHTAGDDLPPAVYELPMFQSTPAHGGRPRTGVDARSCTVVSIHARTRRATRLRGWPDRASGFNPRPHTAGDARPPIAGTPTCVSIHARTRRATASRLDSLRSSLCFNPRPHTAGDRCRAAVGTRLGACFNPRPHTAGDYAGR